MTETKKLPLIPVGYQLLAEERQAELKSKGGILLTAETQDSQQYLNMIGTVVALGNLCYRAASFQNEPWCEVGCQVMFHKHAGMRIDTKAQDDPTNVRYRLLKDNDILAIVNDAEMFRSAVY